ncbi:c-type cytochrome [Niabella sp. CC-SYL272]|uniref:c-type cytochrome n=1 Tax=Niabella agricola TaxID=2891571 RepID=UPI001F36F45F|nr:c-type cytochrome [Niabella agricola]MCF3108227.1 c-type cytochrome [Niabella agricola]
MLRKIFKWCGVVLAAVLVLILVAYAGISLNLRNRMQERYAYAVAPVSIPSDSATLLRGAHLLAIKGCYECHGTQMAGKIVANDGMIGRITAANLTRGKGGLPADYTSEDWFRALQHGIGKDGRPLVLMPAQETTLMSESDIAAIIAYCNRLPPVHNQLPSTRIGPAARILAFFDKIPLLPVEKIDHLRTPDKVADTLEGIGQGKYLAASCSGCHGSDLKGGDALLPGMLPAPDFSFSGNAGKWTPEQFIHTLRTGTTPSGHSMKNEDMPWQMTARYTDKELASLYQYFRSLK